MAGWKEYAHEIRKRATDYPAATVQHVAMYAKDNNRVYIIDENSNLVDFQVADIFCYNIDVSETAEVGETLSVSGNGYFWSDLHVEDNTFIGGIVDVSGNGYFWSDVIIDGNLLVNGDVVMGDDLEVVGDASISGSVYIAGKLTVDGLIDPTGLQLTPISANPGDAYTIWANSGDNLLYFGSSTIPVSTKNGILHDANNGGGTLLDSNIDKSFDFIIRIISTTNGNLRLYSSIIQNNIEVESWIGHTYTTLISGDCIQGDLSIQFMPPVGLPTSPADTAYVKLSFRKTNSTDTEHSETISYYTPSPSGWNPQMQWFTTGNTSISVQYTSRK
jgi:hypothetical protein